MNLEWMAWTTGTALFFIAIGLMLIGMGVAQVVYPTVERRGFLPIETTRGDRLFISLLGGAYVHLAWIGLTDQPVWWASVIAVVSLVALMRWG